MSKIDDAKTMLQVADNHIKLAVAHVWAAKEDYLDSDLPSQVRKARVAALESKIAALKDTHASPEAHPWKDDQ